MTLLSGFWLMCTSIPKEQQEDQKSSMGAILSLLKDKRILLLFFGIFFVVGIDVGTNTVAPKLLIERVGMEVEAAGFGSSVYFVCRTIGALLGSVLLLKIPEVRYFRINIFAALAAMGLLFGYQFVPTEYATITMLALVGLVGFFCSSIFLIMGVSGGALIPPAMGAMTDLIGSQIGSLIVLTCTLLYLSFCALWLKDKR